jgi:hypothetical protein
VTNYEKHEIYCESEPGGTDTTEYVQRIDRTPIRTTPNPKLALVMGRFTGRGRCQIHPKFPVHLMVRACTG